MTNRRRIAPAGLLILLVIVVWVFDRHYRFFDLAIYQGAVRWWLAGGELYGYQAPVQGNLGFTYPPFAALILLPIAPMSLATAGWLSVAAGVAALTVALRAVTGARHPAVLALIVVAALTTEPVRQTLGLGQVNLALFALVVVDLLVLTRSGSRWAGAGVGLATAIKLTPGLFIVYLLVTRQWRTAIVATATCAGLTVAAALVASRETVQYFGDLLWHTERVGAADAVANQSLAGLLARLDAPAGWWLPLSLVVLAVGLARASRAYAGGRHAWALALVGLTANLVTPVAWTHHLMFLPVALLILADAGRRPQWMLAIAGYLVCVVSPIWWAPLDPLAGNAFVILMLLLVVCPLDVHPASVPKLSSESPAAPARRA
jgi:alpha-1,2-mannosyltransferase